MKLQKIIMFSTFLFINQANTEFQFAEEGWQLPQNTGIAGHVIERRKINTIVGLTQEGIQFLSMIENGKNIDKNAYDNWNKKAHIIINENKNYKNIRAQELLSELQHILNDLENKIRE